MIYNDIYYLNENISVSPHFNIEIEPLSVNVPFLAECNIKDYEEALSTLFLLNAFNVLSDGNDYSVGTTSSEIFHYTP